MGDPDALYDKDPPEDDGSNVCPECGEAELVPCDEEARPDLRDELECPVCGWPHHDEDDED